MSRTSRLTKRASALVDADLRLRRRIIPELELVVAGRQTDFFITDQNNPWREVRPSAVGSEIFVEAQQIVDEAKHQGMDLTDFAASAVVATFTGANDLSNANRLGPIRLAGELLHRLGRADTSAP